MTKLNAATAQQISTLVTAGTADHVLPQLGAFTRLVATSGLLSRALSESGSTAEAKSSLLTDLTKGKLSADTIATIVAATEKTDAKTVVSRLFDTVVELALAAAVAGNEVEVVENGLYAVATSIIDNSALRQALSDPGVADTKKQALLLDLMNSALDARTFEIVRTLVSVKGGKELDVDAKALSFRAAERRDAVVAEIRTAVELDDSRKATLLSALQAQAGKVVSGRFTVDASVVGSVIVRIGDDVLDGSIRHRFEQARVALSRA